MMSYYNYCVVCVCVCIYAYIYVCVCVCLQQNTIVNNNTLVIFIHIMYIYLFEYRYTNTCRAFVKNIHSIKTASKTLQLGFKTKSSREIDFKIRERYCIDTRKHTSVLKQKTNFLGGEVSGEILMQFSVKPWQHVARSKIVQLETYMFFFNIICIYK